MSDQAQQLRTLIQTAIVSPKEDIARLPMVVVAGARNGVGATTVAVNLAAAIADRGERVLVVDAAESGNELAEMAGVARNVEHFVSDIMSGKCDARDAIVDGPTGLYLLANRGGVGSRRGRESRRDSSTGSENSRDGQQRLLSSIDSLCDEIDLVVVDVGIGLTAWT